VTLTRIHASVVLAIVFTCATIARAAPIYATDIWVIDGDTIRVYSSPTSDSSNSMRRKPAARPVTWNAHWEIKPHGGVRELVRGGSLDFEFVACSCRPGMEETPSCNYGRSCGTLKAAGRDVSEIFSLQHTRVRSFRW
jgi:hypothetical protein